MPNNLTGDFDVVAEFATLAVNRVLAAMHRYERFPHSMSVRVDDNPPPSKVGHSIVASVDIFGDATVNHNHIGLPGVSPGQLSAADPRYRLLDPVVNTDLVGVPPVVPSKLQGRAQLQLSPPMIEVTDASGTNLTVKLQVMARYFPDPHTSRVAEFVRGELQITAPVDQVASQDPNVRAIDVDIRSPKVKINFSPKWSSHPVSANQPLSDEDVAGVNLLIRNALKTSFLPSNNPLPSNINYMQFKTLLGGQNAISVLLNINSPRGNPASMNNVFLGAGDDFAFAAGIDYLRAAFQPTIDNIVSQSYSVTIPVDVGFSTYHVVYSISLTSGTLDLPNGKIVLTMQGRAVQTSHKWYAPDEFTFTAQLTFTLKVDGATVHLEPGDVSLDTSSWIVNLFKGSATDGMKQVRDEALDQSGADSTVRDMFDANKNLGGFLNSLLNPADQDSRRVPHPEELKPVLAYSSVEINSSGIILHGSLAVPDWPSPHVEFEQIPATAGVGGGAGVTDQGPNYSALKSWIPGGTIESYEWSMQGQAQPFLIDKNKFVLIPEISTGTMAFRGTLFSSAVSPGAVSGYTALCLTVKGTRITSSGPVVDQPVSASHCGYTRVSILEGTESTLGGALLMVALTQPGPRGLVEVPGHAWARSDGAGGGTPNRLVHFANEKTAGHLEFLTQALRESKRGDAATAVLAVLAPDLLAKTRYTEGVIYAEDQGGAWARAFGVKTTRRPLTLIAGPNGKVAWQHEGDLDSEKLAAALGKNLARGGPVRLGMVELSLRIGWPAPNFLFELAPGRGLTLRKLEGRPTMLVFWKSSSRPSIEAVGDLQKTAGKVGGQGPVVLAINDGEASELAKKVAAENGLSAILVPDPKREISLAYGVSIWPTAVFIDALGLVRNIRYGRFAREQVERPTEAKAAAGQSARKMA